MMLDGEEEESDVEEASDVKKRIFRNVPYSDRAQGRTASHIKPYSKGQVLEATPR